MAGVFNILDSKYYKQYMEFLKEVDDARCGVVDLWLEVGQVLYGM
ncbi:hypothetical protein AB4124_03635 [Paenibacillus sp. 2KB_20]